MSRKPSSVYSQKCASLRTICMVRCSASPGCPKRRRMMRIHASTRPLESVETVATAMELEKMNQIQAMSATVKTTRPAMTHSEVRSVSL